jgi:hypothetical protein
VRAEKEKQSKHTHADAGAGASAIDEENPQDVPQQLDNPEDAKRSRRSLIVSFLTLILSIPALIGA